MKKFLIPIATALFFMAVGVYAGEDDVYKYNRLSSTTTISILPVKLHTIVISSGTSSTVGFNVYDSTSPNVTTPVIASFPANPTVGTYTFDIQTQNGLQINAPASGPQATVSYR